MLVRKPAQLGLANVRIVLLIAESLAYNGGQYMDGLEMGRQQSSGQEQGSAQLPVDPSG